MADEPKLTRFVVRGLRRTRNVDIRVQENTLILVGENGSSKTTLLRMLFYFLSGRWHSLANINFDEMTITIDETEYNIRSEQLEGAVPALDERLLNRLAPTARRKAIELYEASLFDELESHLSDYSDRYGLPKYLSSSVQSIQTTERTKLLAALSEQVSAHLGAQILYLPTYRRIERELSSIFQGVDADDARRLGRTHRQPDDGPNFVELVEFGMRDVQQAIDRAVDKLKSFQLAGSTRLSLSYLGDVVSQAYVSTDSSSILTASKETIEAVFRRIDATILNNFDQSHLRDIITKTDFSESARSEHELIISHYFTKLLDFQKELEEREVNVKSFCKLCSEYIADKYFLYDSEKFLFSIVSKVEERPIQLSDLSSGEKQIVSLFSHLLLSGRTKFFVMIDEPELSLSVPWQRRFLLDIKNASFCAGLIAVTHSPFIYDNELRKSTHAIGEFVGGPDWGLLK